MINECKKKKLVPGERCIHIISAMSGHNAEKILLAIANPPGHNPDNQRYFGGWQSGVCQGEVYSEDDGSKVPITLKLDCRDGLFLEDVPISQGFSLKPKNSCSPNQYSLPIGRRITDHQIRGAANAIIGTWILHGFRWLNRHGAMISWPYGECRRNDVDLSEYAFVAKDGTAEGALLSLGELIAHGGVRSAHVGEWLAPFSVVAAAAGMPVLLHEWNENGRADDFNVCSFGNLNLSPAMSNLWGPVCAWNLDSRRELSQDPRFGSIAEAAVSPFAFHVHATRQVFNNCRLFSSFLLDSLNAKQLTGLLERIVEDDPGRFYKLVDRNGSSRRLQDINAKTMRFEGGEIIERKSIADNVIASMIALAELEKNPALSTISLPAVVLDSHFYIVLPLGILTSRGGNAYHLGGSEMHRYLTLGDQARMHAIRNERFYRLMCANNLANGNLRFHIYPSQAIALAGVTQYSFKRSEFNLDRWRDTILK